MKNNKNKVIPERHEIIYTLLGEGRENAISRQELVKRTGYPAIKVANLMLIKILETVEL